MALKLRTLTKFPALVQAAVGLAVERVGRAYTFMLDLAALSAISAIADQTKSYLVIVTPGETDDDPDVYERMKVSEFNSVIGGYLVVTNNLSDLDNVVTARQNLGVISKGTVVGLYLSNNASDANNDIDISAGEVMSISATPRRMALASAITKRLDAAWAAGTANGGIDAGSKAASTTYWIWIIRKDSDGTIDALFSTSSTAPTMPAGYTEKRVIGAVTTNGSSNIIQFSQSRDRWYWFVTPPQDVVNQAQGTTATLRSLTSVPTGQKVLVRALYGVNQSATAGGAAFFAVSDPDVNVAGTAATFIGYHTTAAWVSSCQFECWTNTTRQIYTCDTDATSSVSLYVQGYFIPVDAYI